MKLLNQVCTLEQAKKLKELGVCQDSQSYWRRGYLEHVEGVNSWSDEQTLGEMIKHYDANRQPGWRDKAELFSAYNVAELGVMLNTYTGNIRKSDNADYWYAYLDTYQQFKTEAEARAALLICRLEWKAITAEEVNKLLQAA